MGSPSPLHQSSLEGVIDFSREPPLGAEQRINAKRRFYRIVEHVSDSKSSNKRTYSRPRLVRFTYEYALCEESRDNFLRAFFRAMALSMDGDDEFDYEELGSVFFGFADYLLDNFFLPCKARRFDRRLYPSLFYC
ncbi:Uncharacterized protein TPAR_05261 [Tolypocladium paradoxum]|uniref:Uncharacterized protein n=1 Tax=Tolypocladium paradoxum TaxID=94208 RepID=A0A2S4KWE8_9HYPO|nr:Uncharacterized protein TPAR_05261 [Tolypocladium paradoxum]